MCRHAGYVGPPLQLARFLDDPDHSLVSQAYRPREMLTATLNADGFGVGWYLEDGVPGIYTNPMPIWSDQNLMHLGSALVSQTWIGNVRSATPGQAVNQANTHPFTGDGLIFSHNGFITDFLVTTRHKLRRLLRPEIEASIQGSTDSEHIFAGIRQAVDAADGNIVVALRAFFDSLSELLGGTSSLLNVLIADGQSIYATRHAIGHESPTLYVGTDTALFPGGTLIASERLTENGDWEVVPEHHIVVASPGGEAAMEPL